MSSQETLITTHSVETPSGRISYASAGSGPAALFVHGVVLNKHAWRHQLAGLSDLRRCIAVDLLARGVPTGISGQALTARAFIQAQKFGAQFAIPVSVEKLDCSNPPLHRVKLDNGVCVFGRTVVIASGARYRRPDIDNLHRFEETSVSYWATPIEANLRGGRDIVLVGGGNSAGQAAVFLALYARRIHLVVRSAGLEASMSRYLIDRITATPNVELRVHTAVTGLSGTSNGDLESVLVSCRETGDSWQVDARDMFLFIGADPDTQWLDRRIALDNKGFVLTGQASQLPLETSSRGVFAIGDVRKGSIKRVAAGVGEDAAAVAQIHSYLATL